MKIFKKIFQFFNNNRGFTLVELLVVFSITLFLLGGIAFYNRNVESQLLLVREQANIINSIQKAKHMSVAAYLDKSTGTVPCGYGIHFSSADKSIIIFKETSADPNCGDIDNKYDATDDTLDCSAVPSCVEKIFLDKTIQFSQLDPTDILFIPPDPKVIITPNPSPPTNESIIKIKSPQSLLEKTITINTSGQITSK